MPDDLVKNEKEVKEDKQNPEVVDNEVKQVSEFEKDELFDPNNIAALIDKSKEETAETTKKNDKVRFLNGTVGFLTDMLQVNKRIVRKPYPLPKINDMIQKIRRI